MLLSCLFAFLGGWALDKYGPRIVTLLMGLLTGLSLLLTSQANSSWQLFITYSLLLSAGTSAVYVVIVSTVSRWFSKNRGFALGIATSGAGLGIVIMAPVAAYLITDFSWRIAYIVLGLIAWLVVLPLSMLLRQDPREVGALPDGTTSASEEMDRQEPENEEASSQLTYLSLPQALKTRSFWCFGAMWLLFGSGVYLVLTHIVPCATDTGISSGEAATILSVIGGAGIVGRVLMGSTSDKLGRKLTVIICSLLQVGAMLWLIWAQALWMFYLFALVYGFARGGLTTTIGALIGDTFGLYKIGVILGLLEIGWGIGATIGPVLGGVIFDVSSDYSIAFLIGAAAMLVATLLVVPVGRETTH